MGIGKQKTFFPSSIFYSEIVKSSLDSPTPFFLQLARTSQIQNLTWNVSCKKQSETKEPLAATNNVQKFFRVFPKCCQFVLFQLLF